MPGLVEARGGVLGRYLLQVPTRTSSSYLSFLKIQTIDFLDSRNEFFLIPSLINLSHANYLLNVIIYQQKSEIYLANSEGTTLHQ